MTKITVALPVYNGEKYVAETIKSVLSQTHRDFELLIVDDASSDNSSAICQSFANEDTRIRFLRNETNQGVGDTLRRMFRDATGEFIAQIGHDDVYLPHHLEQLLVPFSDKKLVAAFGGVSYIDGESRRVENINIFDPSRIRELDQHTLFASLLGGNFLCAPSSMVRKSAVAPSFLGCRNDRLQDHELWLQLLKHGPFAYAPQAGVLYRWHSTNLSRQGYKSTQGRFELFTLMTRVLFDSCFLQMVDDAEDSESFLHEVISNLLRVSGWCPPVELLAASLYENVCLHLDETHHIQLDGSAALYQRIGLIERALSSSHNKLLDPIPLVIDIDQKTEPFTKRLLSTGLFNLNFEADPQICCAIHLIKASDLSLKITDDATLDALRSGRAIIVGSKDTVALLKSYYPQCLLLDDEIDQTSLRRQTISFIEDRQAKIFGHPLFQPAVARGELGLIEVSGLIAHGISQPVKFLTLPNWNVEHGVPNVYRGDKQLKVERRMSEGCSFVIANDIAESEEPVIVRFQSRALTPPVCAFNNQLLVSMTVNIIDNETFALLQPVGMAATAIEQHMVKSVVSSAFSCWQPVNWRLEEALERETAFLDNRSYISELHGALRDSRIRLRWDGQENYFSQGDLYRKVANGSFVICSNDSVAKEEQFAVLISRSLNKNQANFAGFIDNVLSVDEVNTVISGWVGRSDGKPVGLALSVHNQLLTLQPPTYKRADVNQVMNCNLNSGFKVMVSLPSDWDEIILYAVAVDGIMIPVSKRQRKMSVDHPPKIYFEQFYFEKIGNQEYLVKDGQTIAEVMAAHSRGQVDKIYTENDSLVISGWAFPNESEPKTIYIVIGDRVVGSIVSFHDRPDVNEHLGRDAVQVAFHAKQSLRNLGNPTPHGDIQLIAVGRDTRGYRIPLSGTCQVVALQRPSTSTL